MIVCLCRATPTGPLLRGPSSLSVGPPPAGTQICIRCGSKYRRGGDDGMGGDEDDGSDELREQDGVSLWGCDYIATTRVTPYVRTGSTQHHRDYGLPVLWLHTT